MNIYTVYRNPNARSEEEILMLVPEGFSWWGFFFPLNIIWSLSHRSWLFFFISLALFIIYLVAMIDPFPHAQYVNITKLPVQLFLGVFMYDFYRLTLRRRGYHYVDVVSGKNDTEALLNYLNKTVNSL
jgi:hypothetical protein